MEREKNKTPRPSTAVNKMLDQMKELKDRYTIVPSQVNFFFSNINPFLKKGKKATWTVASSVVSEILAIYDSKLLKRLTIRWLAVIKT